MQTLVLEDLRDLHLRTVDDPKVGRDDVLIKIKACGICGSDIHGYDGSSGRRIPPITMGHEAAGIVHSVGESVTRFQPGDRVTFDSTVFCGACDFCKAGQVNLCEARQVVGVSCGDYRRNGAFAEFLAVPERILYKLPDDLSFEHGALVEPVAIAVHAVRISQIEANTSAVVVGCGMIGLLIVQALKVFGCLQIFAVDLEESKLELAKKFGAEDAFLASDPDIFDKLRAATGGHGPHLAMEVVGAQRSISTAIEAVRRGGRVTIVGNLAPRVEIPLQVVVTRELKLQGSCGSAGEYPECIELIRSGAIDVNTLLSAIAPLEEGAAWFNRLYAREPGLMKVVLQP